jgi:ribokinase
VDGDNYIVLERGANACLTKEDIDKTLATANEGDIYLTQLENPIDVIGYGLRRAKEKKLYVILNPAPADRSIGAYLSYVDLVVPNETETEILGGEENILCQTGGELIVTVGSKGFVCYDKKGGKSAYPCIKVKPVDTTAAGDTFCGGLAAKLAMGKPLTDSAKYGSLAASIACTRKGAQPSVPTKEEVEAYIAKNNLEL